MESAIRPFISFGIQGVESEIQKVESGIQGLESGISRVECGIQGVKTGIQRPPKIPSHGATLF